MMGKNKKTTGDTYLAVGIGIGLPLGAVLGFRWVPAPHFAKVIMWWGSGTFIKKRDSRI